MKLLQFILLCRRERYIFRIENAMHDFVKLDWKSNIPCHLRLIPGKCKKPPDDIEALLCFSFQKESIEPRTTLLKLQDFVCNKNNINEMYNENCSSIMDYLLVSTCFQIQNTTFTHNHFTFIEPTKHVLNCNTTSFDYNFESFDNITKSYHNITTSCNNNTLSYVSNMTSIDRKLTSRVSKMTSCIRYMKSIDSNMDSCIYTTTSLIGAITFAFCNTAWVHNSLESFFRFFNYFAEAIHSFNYSTSYLLNNSKKLY